MGLPQITGALKVEIKDNEVIADRDNENTSQTLACAMPAVITVMRSPDLRFASIKGKMKARKADVPMLSAADINVDLETVGKKGSPTQVMKSFTPTVVKVDGEVYTDEDPAVAVDKLVAKLIEDKIITR